MDAESGNTGNNYSFAELPRELREGAARLGVALPEGAEEKFLRFAELLSRESKRMNLTAVPESEYAARHFADSLAPIAAAGGLTGESVIDVGAGAGFPGLPMLFAAPGIRLTELDSTEKKVNFMSGALAELGLSASCVCGRAEELALRADMRESFDLAVSRAVARLNVLCELCLPFVKVGGRFLAMKNGGAEETGEAKSALKALGGVYEGCFEYEIMGAARAVVVIRKAAPTPGRFPRRFAKIQKQPL